MEMDHAKPPEDCASLAEIRSEIDRLDQSIVDAIGRRRHYVLAAAKFKTSATAVAAPERVAAMLQSRRQWAEQAGLNPDMIEELFRNLVNHFTAEEMTHWKAGPSSAS